MNCIKGHPASPAHCDAQKDSETAAAGPWGHIPFPMLKYLPAFTGQALLGK